MCVCGGGGGGGVGGNPGKLFIQCNTDSCCEHIVASNITLYGCVIFSTPVSTVICLCLCV